MGHRYNGCGTTGLGKPATTSREKTSKLERGEFVAK